MTDDKRFYLGNGENCTICDSSKGGSDFFNMLTKYEAVDKLNQLYEENEQLKKELRVYREVASCSNCKYHNYDWYDDGDEFEVCDNGNDVTDGICKDWEELE